MVAAELRNWLFNNFAVDVPLFDRLDADTTIRNLEDKVAQNHQQKLDGI